MQLKAILIILWILSSGIFYYYSSNQESSQIIEKRLKRVIDGDTIEIENNQRVRLLGINTPEKNMKYYSQAKEFLENNLENQIKIKAKGKDKYQRILGHIFSKGNYLNEALLKEGFATLYYYEKDSYFNQLKGAEDYARKNEIGLWKKSSKKDCLNLIQLKYIENTKRCSNEELIKIENSCDEDLKITIKDDATHIYKEVIKANSIFTKNFSCIFNDAGDSLYIRDEQGLLLFYRY